MSDTTRRPLSVTSTAHRHLAGAAVALLVLAAGCGGNDAPRRSLPTDAGPTDVLGEGECRTAEDCA
ncbi:MAG: hypothetical protein ABEL76_14775, partial [Bradymonadaceae bacterium]